MAFYRFLTAGLLAVCAGCAAKASRTEDLRLIPYPQEMKVDERTRAIATLNVELSGDEASLRMARESVLKYRGKSAGSASWSLRSTGLLPRLFAWHVTGRFQ